jgi:hypothetical protein
MKGCKLVGHLVFFFDLVGHLVKNDINTLHEKIEHQMGYLVENNMYTLHKEIN